jgi:glycine/D-amino acid oxidase-like deaminating enzyme
MQIAVLGAGITGTCAALELAERGHSVHLYEQSSGLIDRASRWNEGKIHLGFVYARARSRKTAATIIQGAMRFRPLLERWIDKQSLSDAVSDPFLYATHRDTQLPQGAIEAHFAEVAKLVAAIAHQPGSSYVGRIASPIWRKQPRTERETIFDDEKISEVYQTVERSIDPRTIANHLSAVAFAMPNLTILTNTTVTGVASASPSRHVVISAREQEEFREPYDAVINALWQNRIGIDNTAGVIDDRPVIHRFKVGFFSEDPALALDYPTITFVHGSYGDTVKFKDRVYANWYPAGLIQTSLDRMPPSDDAEILSSDLGRIESATLAALGRLLPFYEPALRASVGRWQAGGGYITAWGESGIEDPKSQLHDRFAVGVYSRGSYHSIDTGKYTLGPHFANVACQRVAAAPKHRCGRSIF